MILRLRTILSGAVTYERMLVGALIAGEALCENCRPERRPACCRRRWPATPLCSACYLAGKLPVMLNWTTGPANLAHAARLMQLTHVVTSKAFIDRTAIEVEGTEYLFLEDVRKGMGKLELLRTLAGGTLPAGRRAPKKAESVDPINRPSCCSRAARRRPRRRCR